MRIQLHSKVSITASTQDIQIGDDIIVYLWHKSVYKRKHHT